MLQRAQHPQRVVTVAFERQHRVDDMLEHTGAGQRAVLGDMADEQRDDAGELRQLHQPLRGVPHLGDRARRAGRVRIVEGLDRVDREHVGRELADVREHRGQRRLVDEEHVRVEGAEPLGPQPHLGR